MEDMDAAGYDGIRDRFDLDWRILEELKRVIKKEDRQEGA
jgi:hypothetical protein